MAGVTPICETSSGNKCEKSSNALRLKGNAHYQKRQFNEALKNYNQAILLAPHDGSELALGFANRSALFYETSNWKGCLQDVEHALHHRYPAEKQYKLLKRKAQCLIQLERYQEVSETLQVAKDEANISMIIESDEICGATSNVAIKYNNVRGRHLVAKIKIPAGSTIIKEKPYTGVLLPEFHNTHCHQCFTPTDAPIPCSLCSRVRYCSDECQQSSMTLYHWAECPYSNLLEEVGVYAHLSYRILVVSGVQTVKGQHNDTKVCMETIKSIPGCSSSGCYYGNYQSVWNLVTNENMHPSEDIEHFRKISSELIHKTIDHLLGSKTWTPESCEMLDKSHDQEKSCLIGQLQSAHTRHWLQLYCNAQAVTIIVPSDIQREGRHDVADVEQRRLATAVFPTTSLLNHSCKPNVIVSFKDDEITVRSITTIETDEEILHCYGPHYKRMKKAERQKALKKQYNFECNCDACRLDDSNADNDLKQETIKENSNKKNIKMELSKSMDMFSKANQMLEENKIEDSLALLLQCCEIQTLYLDKYHKNLGQTQDSIARCYVLLGDMSSAVKYLKLSIANVEKWFGPDSIEFANELHKLASILFNMRDVEGAMATINRCLPVLVCHYGNNHESVNELLEMKSTLEHFAL